MHPREPGFFFFVCIPDAIATRYVQSASAREIRASTRTNSPISASTTQDFTPPFLRPETDVLTRFFFHKEKKKRNFERQVVRILPLFSVGLPLFSLSVFLSRTLKNASVKGIWYSLKLYYELTRTPLKIQF